LETDRPLNCGFVSVTTDNDPALIALNQADEYIPQECAAGGAFTLLAVIMSVIFGILSVYKGELINVISHARSNRCCVDVLARMPS